MTLFWLIFACVCLAGCAVAWRWCGRAAGLFIFVLVIAGVALHFSGYNGHESQIAPTRIEDIFRPVGAQ